MGATDRAIGMTRRFAACFWDRRRPELIEDEVVTLVGQRVFGIALGYEDLNDHDELRHDPIMTVLAGKLEARREDCAPVASKSTLNRLELSKLEPTRYHKINHNPIAIRRLMVDLFLEAHERAPNEIILDLDATDRSSAREPGGAVLQTPFITATVICRSTCSVGSICWQRSCGARAWMRLLVPSRRWPALSAKFAAIGPMHALWCAPTAASHARS